jgi:hypothetical protein
MRIATDADEMEFNTAWHDVQPQAVKDWARNGAEIGAGLQLATQGFIIDSRVFIFGESPYRRMKIAQEEGWTWAPSLGMPNVLVAPNIDFPGLPKYDPTMIPLGAIIITLDFDLLQFVFPEPVHVTPAPPTTAAAALLASRAASSKAAPPKGKA